MVWLNVAVYTVVDYTYMCVESVNGSEQAESYLLFHVGFDFSPRGDKEHILYHGSERQRHRQRKLSVINMHIQNVFHCFCCVNHILIMGFAVI